MASPISTCCSAINRAAGLNTSTTGGGGINGISIKLSKSDMPIRKRAGVWRELNIGAAVIMALIRIIGHRKAANQALNCASVKIIPVHLPVVALIQSTRGCSQSTPR